MSNELKLQVGKLASEIIQAAMASGLSWDETVAAMGVASKALVVEAQQDGDGSFEDRLAHAQKRFAEGLSQNARVVFGQSDISQLKRAYEAHPESLETLLVNANWCFAPKPTH